MEHSTILEVAQKRIKELFNDEETVREIKMDYARRVWYKAVVNARELTDKGELLGKLNLELDIKNDIKCVFTTVPLEYLLKVAKEENIIIADASMKVCDKMSEDEKRKLREITFTMDSKGNVTFGDFAYDYSY